jgi:hypothetical protein
MQALNEALFTLIKEWGSVHLIFDRLNGLDLQEALDALKLEPASMAVLDDPYYGDALHRAPLLVRLEMRSLEFIDLTVEQAQKHARSPELTLGSLQGWFFTNCELSLLKTHLKAQMNAFAPTPGRSALAPNLLLRYFDPRLLPRLCDVLTLEQRAHLFGPIKAWVIADRDGTALTLRGSPDGTHPHVKGLSLNATTFQTLARITPLCDVLRQLARQGQPLPRSLDERIDHWLERAQGLGLSESDDQAAYALAALQWPEERGPILNDPGMQQAITHVKTHGSALADTIAAFVS